MKGFKSTLREINITLTELALFENIVNATIIFLAFYLVFSFSSIHFVFSAIPALVYLIAYSILAFKKSKPAIVESKYNPLKEKLRTAADNVQYENPIIEELEYEVTREMKNVGLSLFINPKMLSYKIFIATLLSFLIMFASTLNFKFDMFSLKKVPDIFEKKFAAGNFIATQLETSDDIYGEKDVAKLGDKELNIRIKPVDFRVSVREEGSFETREFEGIFPKDIVVKESIAFEENIAQEDQELVKSYFKKLAES